MKRRLAGDSLNIRPESILISETRSGLPGRREVW